MNVSIEHPQMGYILHESPNPRLEYKDNNTLNILILMLSMISILTGTRTVLTVGSYFGPLWHIGKITITETPIFM